MSTCVAQAKEGIEEADASMGLLSVQSQLGLADRGPLPARALAEAALQVTCSPHSCSPHSQLKLQACLTHLLASWSIPANTAVQCPPLTCLC